MHLRRAAWLLAAWSLSCGSAPDADREELHTPGPALCDPEGCFCGSDQNWYCPGGLHCDPVLEYSCPPYNCNDVPIFTCKTSCTSDADCTASAMCVAGACIFRVSTGDCVQSSDCGGGLCLGGHCCASSCPADKYGTCGATACEATTGACQYPTNLCQSATCYFNSALNQSVQWTAASCVQGHCATVMTNCGPYACDASGTMCLTPGTCQSDQSCNQGSPGGNYCDTSTGNCRPRVANGGACDAGSAGTPAGGANDACVSGICAGGVCNAPPDLTPPLDLAAPPDLASPLPDLAKVHPDLAAARDLATATGDLAPPAAADLASATDLAPAADLASSRAGSGGCALAGRSSGDAALLALAAAFAFLALRRRRTG